MLYHVSGKALLCLYSGLVYLNSSWLIVSVDPIRVSSTNSGSGNLTAVAHEPLKILCPAGSLQTVERAISNHIHNNLLAVEKAHLGIAFPAFYALYKSDEHKEYIEELFTRMARLGPIGIPWYKPRPTFVCIRSEADTSPYRSTLPTLWDQCMENAPSPPRTIDPIASYETNTLFICRPFFSLSDDTVGPAPEQCPGVHENMFTDELVHAVFATRATYITTFAVNAYSHLPNTQGDLSYIELLNFALDWDANLALTQPWTYLLFERCRS